jgi:hypothetical protein
MFTGVLFQQPPPWITPLDVVGRKDGSCWLTQPYHSQTVTTGKVKEIFWSHTRGGHRILVTKV